MSWFAEVPANIALIKYMGKADPKHNIPSNPSLSYALDRFITQVILSPIDHLHDRWEPLEKPGIAYTSFSEKAQTRFLNHLQNIKHYFNYSGSFLVRSGNNFPHGTGLASSASSFAALTQCAVTACAKLTNQPIPSIQIQAMLSQQGSGSSCRSFFSPWAYWDHECVQKPLENLPQLEHQVILVDTKEKTISSSVAHQRVLTSPHFATRPSRAQKNLQNLLHALTHHDWKSAYQICWKEFQDMHQLFATASTPFQYMNQETIRILNRIQNHWITHQDGPLVTMDAGPNIHLLYRTQQEKLSWENEHVL